MDRDYATRPQQTLDEEWLARVRRDEHEAAALDRLADELELAAAAGLDDDQELEL